jgi:predicted HTH transcriptional regulator
MLPAVVQQLILDGESESVEFKRDVPQLGVLTRTLAAFANGRGGVLLLGVQEGPPSNKAVGVDADRAEVVIRRAVESLEPHPEVQTTRVFIDDFEVLAVEVTASRQLTLAPDGLFIRAGESIRPFTPSEAVARLSERADPEATTRDAATLAQAVASLTEQLETQKPLLQSLKEANHWTRKLLWIVVGAVAGGLAKEPLPLLFR